MSNLFSLLKISFINGLGISKLRKMPKQRMLVYGIFFLFIFANLLVTMFTYANGLFSFLEKYQLQKMMLPIFAFFVYISTVYFSMYTAKNTLFECKDNDLLLSMPISPKTILFSRVLKLFLINLVINLFIFVPAIIVYSRNMALDFTFYPIIILITLFLPLVPTIIASLIGYFIAFVTSKFNTKNLFEVIFSLVLVFGVLYLTMSIQDILTALVNNINQVESIIKYLSYPIYTINQIMLVGSNINLIYFIIYNIVVTILFILILSKSYFKIIHNLKKVKVKANYQMRTLVTNSQTKALLKKEIKRYFSSPVYVLNTAFGSILLLIFAVATVFKPDIINSIFDGASLIKPVEIIGLMVIAVCGLDNTTASSISLEGNSFWFLKSLPVSTKKVFKAKALVNIIVNVPACIIALLILSFSFKLKLLEIFILIALVTVFSVFTSYLGLIINLMFPKFEFQNDAQVVKQSAASGIAIFGAIFVVAIIAVLYTKLNISYNTYAILVIGFFVIVSMILKIVLNNWGTKKFAQLP